MAITGWSTAWIGHPDYRCQICRCGFGLDELVYITKDGLPFHKECLDPMEYRNRMRRSATVIGKEYRIKESQKEGES